MKSLPGSAFDPAARLLDWFAIRRRDLSWRKNRSLYSVWVAEVMLQQTRTATANGYYRSFLERFPSLAGLAAAPLPEVLKVWEGLGYYSRARHLWLAARAVHENHGGRIPTSYAEFRKLPGVGEYTAAAVLSIACGQALAAVDGNVLRVVCRWRGIETDIRSRHTRDAVRAFLQEIIPPAAPGEFNEAMMELGALVCTTKNPVCGECPLRTNCHAYRRGLTAVLPFKSRRPPPPLFPVALAVIVRGSRLYIQQRPEQGHLGGLWEFPGGKCRAGEKPERAVVRECREELAAEVEVLAKLAQVGHAYSHFHIVLHVFACRLRGSAPCPLRPHAWVQFAELRHYPFPAANHKFFSKLKEYMDKNLALGAGRTLYGKKKTK
ncbi:MAG TPA: A/G-specific adenine glycosylase [Patescibacteria group bacterium]|nr:A/G-specific adenine glycosylase [Patescibacteria group bacterium]